MAESLKTKILKLRAQGKVYNEIKKTLNCSKSIISLYCTEHNVADKGRKLQPVSLETKKQIAEFCKTNNYTAGIAHFGLSRSTVFKYRNFKE